MKTSMLTDRWTIKNIISINYRYMCSAEVRGCCLAGKDLTCRLSRLRTRFCSLMGLLNH